MRGRPGEATRPLTVLDLPAYLLRFDPTAWPGDTYTERHRRWWSARVAWARAHRIPLTDDTEEHDP